MSFIFSVLRRVFVISAILLSSLILADVIEAASLRLNWKDTSNNESGFKVERKAADGSFAQLATVGANVTSYIDSSVSAGRSYCYTVRAFNSAGISDPTNLACITTVSEDSNSTLPESNGGTTGSTTTTGSSPSGVDSVPLILSDNRVFVQQQYLDFLDREPDPQGFFAWVNALDSGLPKASMIEAFMASGEFRFKGKFIAQTYLGILTRDAEHSGFRGWLGVLLEGMSRQQIVQFFLDSGEFEAKFGGNLTNQQFVQRMYANVLLRAPDTGGFNFWLGQLNSGQLTRAQVALGFLDSVEFQNLAASQNRVDLSLLYFNMLRRDRDAGEFSDWLEALNSGLPLTSVIGAFLMSGEYQAQF